MWNRARAAIEEARAMGVPTFNSSWFGGGTTSTAVLTPAQVAAVAPLVRVTAAYIVMYYSFCFFQSWSKLYLFAAASYLAFFSYVDSCSCASSFARRSSRLFDEARPPPTSGVRGRRLRAPRLAWRGSRIRDAWCLGSCRGDGVPSSASRDRACYATIASGGSDVSARDPPYAIDARGPIRHRRDPRHRQNRRDAADAISTRFTTATQAADAAAERRRQEADARPVKVWRLRVF